MNNTLDLARTQLIYLQPLYALLLQRCNVRWEDKIPTAGVRITQYGDVELALNRGFFNSLSEDHRMGLLMHEMLHIIMKHPARATHLNKQIANIAMDISINQFIPKEMVPPGALLPEQFGFTKDKNFEYYYEQLMKDMKSTKSKQPLDEHNWEEQQGEEGDDALPQEIKENILQDMVDKSVHETKIKFPGKISQQLLSVIKDSSNKGKINWKVELRNFIGQRLSKHRESTRTKPNRRMGWGAMGTKSEYTPNILIAIDESGSVDDSKLATFMDEIGNILNHSNDKIEVVHFDTAIVKKEKLSKVSKKTTRYSCGGTDFNCIIDYAKEVKPDLIIFFTDGEASTPRTTKIPILWTIINKYNKQMDHLKGKKLFLE